MKIARRASGRGLVIGVAALAATVCFAACNSGGGGGGAPGAAATGAAAPAAAAGDVVRYPQETADSGSYTAWQAVRARKSADPNSETVMILQPGSGVQRIAKYGGFTLVQWGTPQGPKMAWVETSQMIRPILYDAGVGTGSFGASNFGGATAPGVGATPQPVVTAPATTTTVPKPATTPVKGNTPKPPGK
jgi:hypothetical protein